MISVTSCFAGRIVSLSRLECEPGPRGDVMSELPDRPDLDQLRRQARELQRAAADGEPHALARLRAVSEHVSLSAAQLAVAREYGFSSWPSLRTEAEYRRRMSAARAADRAGGQRAEDRRSFGGATAV